MSKLYACIITPNKKRDETVLLSIASQFSYGIQKLDDGFIDLERQTARPQPYRFEIKKVAK